MTISPLALDEQTRRRLGRLTMAMQRGVLGRFRGERISKRKGSSQHFADFREYTPGDDVRHIDWNLYARLDQVFLKEYFEEEDLLVTIFVDASASMHFGEPSKFVACAQLALALSFIGVMRQDRVKVVMLGGDGEAFGPRRGRDAYRHILQFLTKGLNPEVQDKLSKGFSWSREMSRHFRKQKPAYAFLLSDFWSEEDLLPGFNLWSARGVKLVPIRCLTKEEREPDQYGEFRFLDAESGQPREVTAHATVLRDYRERLKQEEHDQDRNAVAHGYFWHRMENLARPEEVVHELVRNGGVIR